MSRFRYTLHNIVGHPAMELAHLCGLPSLALWLHETTLPAELRGKPLALSVEAGEYFDWPERAASEAHNAWMREVEATGSLSKRERGIAALAWGAGERSAR